MENIKTLPLIVTVCLSLTACGGDKNNSKQPSPDNSVPKPPTAETPIQTTTISGKIIDKNTLLPISNAIVKINDKSVQTNTQGVYSLNNIMVGNVSFAITAQGYSPLTETRAVNNNANVFDFQLLPVTVTNQPTNNPQISVYRLDAIEPTLETQLLQLNNLARQGYLFVAQNNEGNISYKPSNMNMELEYKSTLGNVQDISVLNNMGKEGWLYKATKYDTSTKSSFDIYLKDKLNPKTYEYKKLTGLDPVVDQANIQGVEGWRLISDFYNISKPKESYYLYYKDNSATKYEYVRDLDGKTVESLRQQIVNRAKDGWLYRGATEGYGSGVTGINTKVQLFERPIVNHPPLDCEVIDAADYKPSISRLNEFAAKGYVWLGLHTQEDRRVTPMTFGYADVYCKGVISPIYGIQGPLLP